MSDNDQVKPYHAKGAAPGQEAADVVAEVLAHAAEREEAAQKKVGPKGPPRWMLPLTVNLGVLALYFLIAQPDFLVMNPLDEDPRPAASQVATAKSMMGMIVGSIESFQLENGRLPASLEEANAIRERPGALLNFLTHLGQRWNISMFHYRNQGAGYGRVLVGLYTVLR